MKRLTIRPLKMLRDNLNKQGKREQADKVQVAILMLQRRNDNPALAESLEKETLHYLRRENIPFNRSLKGERTSFVTDFGKFIGGDIAKCRIHVCHNLKGSMEKRGASPYAGRKQDRYDQYQKAGQHIIGQRN